MRAQEVAVRAQEVAVRAQEVAVHAQEVAVHAQAVAVRAPGVVVHDLARVVAECDQAQGGRSKIGKQKIKKLTTWKWTRDLKKEVEISNAFEIQANVT